MALAHVVSFFFFSDDFHFFHTLDAHHQTLRCTTQIDDNSDDEDKGVRPLMKVPVAL